MTRERKKLTKRQWGWLIFGMTYLLSPIDFLPDPIPGGNCDDAAVIAFVIKKVLEQEETK